MHKGHKGLKVFEGVEEVCRSCKDEATYVDALRMGFWD